MEVRTRIIPAWDGSYFCKFCDKEATDEIVMNDTIEWFLCIDHKYVYDMILAFNDLIYGEK